MKTAGVLERAQRGDEDAYGTLVSPYRSALQAHCYRMLGSIQDAEDAVQDTLLLAWRGLPRFEGRSSLHTWLYTIATNTCLKAIERRGRRMLPVDHGPPAGMNQPPGEPLVESIWIEPYPDRDLGGPGGPATPAARYEQRESVELAFIAALQHLPARQRAVLILRDVLGFSAREVAESLDTTPASVHSALQRAHKTVGERVDSQSQQATLVALGDAPLRRLVDRYVRAWESCDVDSILAMLTEDAVLAMPPRATWYRGGDAIGAFLAEWPLAGGRWQLVPIHASGQIAFGSYRWDARAGAFAPHADRRADTPRRAHLGDHGIHDPGRVPALRAAVGAGVNNGARHRYSPEAGRE